MSASWTFHRLTLALGLTLGMYASVSSAQTASQKNTQGMQNMPGMAMSAGGSSSMAPMLSSAPSAATSSSPSGAAGAASSQAFQAADATMMHRMSTPYSGDTDRDFVEHMMPHHEGAVAMARIELQYGKDPSLKRMARDIIKSQNEEIVFMKQWLKHHPTPSGK